MSDVLILVAAWFLTYLVLGGCIFVLLRSRLPGTTEVRVALLRTAFYGALLTATGQVGLGYAPFGSLAALGHTVQGASQPPATRASRSDPGSAGTPTMPRVAAEATLPGSDAPTMVPQETGARPVHHRVPWLTLCGELAVPIAWGLWRPEVCLPTCTVDRLSAAQLGAVLAHEVEHLARRDPFWITLRLGLTGVLFLQPLQRCWNKELALAAEQACDEWALRVTRNPHALASSLTEIAGWWQGEPALVGSASMTARPSHGRTRERPDVAAGGASPAAGYRASSAEQ